MNPKATSRYLVFGGKDADPKGGWLDYQGNFMTREAAGMCAEDLLGWHQIVDMFTMDLAASKPPRAEGGNGLISLLGKVLRFRSSDKARLI